MEKESFKELLKTFDKEYELPGWKYFLKTAIQDLKISSQELEAVDFVALTTDMWSATNMVPYMSVTAHYVTESWELQAKCLETAYVPDDHTATVLAEELRECAQEWGITEEKVSCNAIRNLDWPWLNCFGHNLNVAVNYAIK